MFIVPKAGRVYTRLCGVLGKHYCYMGTLEGEKGRGRKEIFLCRINASNATGDLIFMQPSTQPITVFVADDHPIVQSGIKSILDTSSIQIVGEANNGQDLLAKVIDSNANVLILDLNMPDFRDPGGFVRALTTVQPCIRTLVLTSYSDPDLSASLINNGATGFLLKDTMTETLTAAIRHVNDGGLFIAPQIAEAVQKHNRISEGLTQREKEILGFIAEGTATAEIATTLNVTPDTVRKHLKSIYAKLGVSSRADVRQLVKQA